jgi:hypothetical protein
MKLYHITILIAVVIVLSASILPRLAKDIPVQYVKSGNTIYSTNEFKCIGDVLHLVGKDGATKLNDDAGKTLQCEMVELTRAETSKYERG